MQIGAINSVNFGRRSEEYVLPESDYVVHDECEKCDAFEKHAQVVQKAKKDVSPITCALGVASGLFALKKGNKVVSVVRSAAAKGADEVLAVIKKVSKKDLPDKLTNLTDKFGRPASKEASPKVVEKFNDIVDSIFGKDKGKKAVESLEKHGIYMNGKSLFDNAVAAAGAYVAADVVSDVAEDNIDRQNIKKSAEGLNKHYSETANDIVSLLID